MIKKAISKVLCGMGYTVIKTSTMEKQKQEYLHQRIEELPIPEVAATIGPDVTYYMAWTGVGTDECMKKDCLPLLAHFYQPIPNLKDLEERNVWDNISEMRGIDWKPKTYLKNLKDLSIFADECDWPEEQGKNLMQYHTNNNSFSYGCAIGLHTIIRNNKPKRIIEIGSGNSSRVIAAAINLNEQVDDFSGTEYTIIDPYSPFEDESLFPKNTKIIRKQVETVDLSIFEELSENDILFIDSSHVSKIGSDVNYEILDILPIIKKGVYIHFHDIHLPYEYPKAYATTPTFRMFWTEAYLLQAFLSNNDNFKVFLPMTLLQRVYEEEFRKLFPKGNNATAWGSGSFWIERIK